MSDILSVTSCYRLSCQQSFMGWQLEFCYIINKWGVLYSNLNTIKVGDELKGNGDNTARPLEEAINRDFFRIYQT